MDKLLYINTVPDIRIKEIVDYAGYNTNAYKDKYLTFTALEDSTFTFTNDVEYSLDEGQTWVTLEAYEDSPTIT